MMALKMFFRQLFALTIFIALAGCQSVDVRGQFVSDKALNEINAKKPNKSEVVDLIGTPTYVPDYTENTWYYVQRSLARRAWFDPKVVNQRVIQITFNNNGRVIEAILEEDTQKVNIKTESSYTKTYGTEKNGIQKFVKNLGRFNKTTDGATRRKKKK